MVSLEHFDLNDGYATFRPKGPSTVPAFISMLEQAMKACQENGVTRLLVDARLVRHPPLAGPQFFQLGSGMASFWDRGIRLAMVGRPDQIDPERFGILVAENRGMRYSVHTSEAEALRQLLA